MPTMTRYVFTWTTPRQGFLPTFDFVIDCPVPRIADVGQRGVDRHSMVIATICELADAPGHPREFPFIGAAPMEIRNVAPRDDGVVSLWVHVEWFSPLNVSLNLLVANGA